MSWNESKVYSGNSLIRCFDFLWLTTSCLMVSLHLQTTYPTNEQTNKLTSQRFPFFFPGGNCGWAPHKGCVRSQKCQELSCTAVTPQKSQSEAAISKNKKKGSRKRFKHHETPTPTSKQQVCSKMFLMGCQVFFLLGHH